MGKIIVVSNRLPATVKVINGQVKLSKSNGGLVQGLAPLAEVSSCEKTVWVGWPGPIETDCKETRNQVTRAFQDIGCFPVFLPTNISEGFYEGFSNSILWPLLHGLSHRSSPESWWSAYKAANEMFADVLCKSEIIDPVNDIIWIHDYHLFLLPSLLRSHFGSLATIGFFLHVPWPGNSLFKTLPEHETCIRSLLSSDLVGFHTNEFCDAFVNCIHNATGLSCCLGQVHGIEEDAAASTRFCEVGVFPISIDYNLWFSSSSKPYTREIDSVIESVRSQGDHQIIYSLSRLDPSKGICESLHAFQELIETNPQLQSRVSFIIVVIPSREAVEQYASLRNEIDRLVGDINGKFSTLSWAPITFLYRSLSWAETVGLYIAADVMLVAPLRDGLNLVAKEYVAVHSQHNPPGVLVLSRLAGAAAELISAIQVNPNSTLDIVNGLKRALGMGIPEKCNRMNQMSKLLQKHDVSHWCSSFLKRLSKIKQNQATNCSSVIKQLSSGDLEGIIKAFQQAKNPMIFSDYDGTLVKLRDDPSECEPDKQLLEAISSLSKCSSCYILSGRTKEPLGSWFQAIPEVFLVAEHGAWVREQFSSKNWSPSEILDGEAKASWREPVLRLLSGVAAVLPKSTIEQKTSSIVFHFRRCYSADVEPGCMKTCISGLKASLRTLTNGLGVVIVDAKDAVEIRSSTIDKGKFIISRISHQLKPVDFILAIGDDKTDEDMFDSLRLHASKFNLPANRVFTIHVNSVQNHSSNVFVSKAKFQLDSEMDVISMLQNLASSSFSRANF